MASGLLERFVVEKLLQKLASPSVKTVEGALREGLADDVRRHAWDEVYKLSPADHPVFEDSLVGRKKLFEEELRSEADVPGRTVLRLSMRGLKSVPSSRAVPIPGAKMQGSYERDPHDPEQWRWLRRIAGAVAELIVLESKQAAMYEIRRRRAAGKKVGSYTEVFGGQVPQKGAAYHHAVLVADILKNDPAISHNELMGKIERKVKAWPEGRRKVQAETVWAGAKKRAKCDSGRGGSDEEKAALFERQKRQIIEWDKTRR